MTSKRCSQSLATAAQERAAPGGARLSARVLLELDRKASVGSAGASRKDLIANLAAASFPVPQSGIPKLSLRDGGHDASRPCCRSDQRRRYHLGTPERLASRLDGRM